MQLLILAEIAAIEREKEQLVNQSGGQQPEKQSLNAILTHLHTYLG